MNLVLFALLLQGTPDCQTVRECSNSLAALRNEIRLEFDQRATAIDLARAQIDIRLEQMNEFRAQLDRQAATFVTNKELDVKIRVIQEQLDSTARDRATLIGALIVIQFLFGIGFALYMRSSPPRKEGARSRATDISPETENAD